MLTYHFLHTVYFLVSIYFKLLTLYVDNSTANSRGLSQDEGVSNKYISIPRYLFLESIAFILGHNISSI